MPSPDFVMPPEAPLASPAPAPAPAHEPAAERTLTAESPVVVARAARPWRQLTAAALVGVLVGAAIPFSFQAADRAATEARGDALRSTALAYLTAIAAGDADTASALSPPDRGELAPAAVLASASPIDSVEVLHSVVDGDVGIVDIAFRLQGMRSERSLDAEWQGDGWRLTTSLAEATTVHGPSGTGGVRVGGVELAGRVLLYPGRYSTELVETPLVRSGGDAFVVDGDPATPTEAYSGIELTDAAREQAIAVAGARVAACMQTPDCPVPNEGIPPRLEPWVLETNPRGDIELVVAIDAGIITGSGAWHEMGMRAVVDESGGIASWQCSAIDDPSREMEPCGP